MRIWRIEQIKSRSDHLPRFCEATRRKMPWIVRLEPRRAESLGRCRLPAAGLQNKEERETV